MLTFLLLLLAFIAFLLLMFGAAIPRRWDC